MYFALRNVPAGAQAAASFLRYLVHTQLQDTHTSGRRRVTQLVAKIAVSATNTRDEHTCHQRNSNPRYQQSSGLRPTPQTARPPGSAFRCVTTLFYFFCGFGSIHDGCTVELVQVSVVREKWGGLGMWKGNTDTVSVGKPVGMGRTTESVWVQMRVQY